MQSTFFNIQGTLNGHLQPSYQIRRPIRKPRNWLSCYLKFGTLCSPGSPKSHLSLTASTKQLSYATARHLLCDSHALIGGHTTPAQAGQTISSHTSQSNLFMLQRKQHNFKNIPLVNNATVEDTLHRNAYSHYRNKST